jgi:NADH pyrophosphatase NudC (nudix superfamily)
MFEIVDVKYNNRKRTFRVRPFACLHGIVEKGATIEEACE